MPGMSTICIALSKEAMAYCMLSDTVPRTVLAQPRKQSPMGIFWDLENWYWSQNGNNRMHLTQWFRYLDTIPIEIGQPLYGALRMSDDLNTPIETWGDPWSFGIQCVRYIKHP
jgi:hypothetical protein